MRTKLILPEEPKPIRLAANIVYKQVDNYYGMETKPLHLNLIRGVWNEARPLVIWIGGGGWDNVTYSAHVPSMIFLAEAGFHVATVEYRSSGLSNFPAAIEDIKAAIRYLRKNADRWMIDREHIGIMGESAGAHLAALAAVTGDTGIFSTGENPEESDAVSCACDWYGPVDFVTFNSPWASAAWKLMGKPREEFPEDYKMASPVNYVTPQTPPFLLLHGNADPVVPISQSEEFYEKLTANGVETDFYELEGANHADARFYGPEVQQIIVAFFKKHLMNS